MPLHTGEAELKRLRLENAELKAKNSLCEARICKLEAEVADLASSNAQLELLVAEEVEDLASAYADAAVLALNHLPHNKVSTHDQVRLHASQTAHSCHIMPT